jgi:4-carboxymuconolactone decarboxylase
MRMNQATRYETGIAVLKQVGGADYAGPIDALKTTAPDLARFVVEFGYGDVMSASGLDLKTRQLCTVAALAAMGNAAPQLKYHIGGALNVGWSPAAVIEALLLSAVYAGFPCALNGVFAAKEVFQARQLQFAPPASEVDEDRHARGLAAIERISAGAGAAVIRSLQDIAPDLARFIIDFSYGDVLSRPGLDHRARELATVALLTALGTAAPQLKVHIAAALNVGATQKEIVAAIEQMAVYAGFPAAINGIGAAREVFLSSPP